MNITPRIVIELIITASFMFVSYIFIIETNEIIKGLFISIISIINTYKLINKSKNIFLPLCLINIVWLIFLLIIRYK